MERIERSVPSVDGIHSLYTVMYVPAGEVRGLVQLVHGMSEHIERYAPLMQTLAENGFLAFGHDHVGHGKTARDDGELGFIAHRGGYDVLIRDVGGVSDAVAREYPGKKRILFGHSMGSFVVRLYAAVHSNALSGLIVMGTGGPNPAAGVGLQLAKMIRGIRGEKHVSGLVDALAFGTYNDRTEKKTVYDWLSTDLSSVKKYLEDPRCGFPFTVSAMCDLVTLNRNANRKEAYAQLRADLPVYLVAGAEDPVGAYGKGVSQVAQAYRDAGLSNVSVKLYPGARHEILNDFCKAEVATDLLDWIDRII